MMRSGIPALAIALALTMCSEPQGQQAHSLPRPRAKEEKKVNNTGSAELVRAHFHLQRPPSAWTEVVVAGVDLFWVGLPSRGPDDDRGQGVAVVDGKVHSGVEALKATLARLPQRQDAALLARLCSLLLGDNGKPVMEPQREVTEAEAPQLRALVQAPVLAGDVLTYWTQAGAVRRPGLQRHRLTLSTLTLESTSGAQLAQAGQDPVERARRALASGSLFAEKDAVKLLAQSCADPRAAALLAETVAKHPRVDTRGQAAAALGGCHGKVAVEALIAALGDKAAEVRWRAAEALGQIGDAAARPVLEQVKAKDSDASARISAERALGKLR